MSCVPIVRSMCTVSIAAGVLLVSAVRSGAAIPICGSDCDGDGRVAVNELVRVVSAVFDDAPTAICADADLNADGRVAVNEVVYGVNNLLVGCPSARVDAIAATVTDQEGPGWALMIVDHGQVLHSRGYGLANIEKRIPMTPQTYTGIASIAKTVTATAVLMLVERGALEIDDPVSMYLPELERFGDALTVRHLLTHTSGIPDYFAHDTELFARWLQVDPTVAAEAVGILYPYPTDPARFGALLSDARRLDNFDLAAILSEYGTLLSAPGEAYAYSNTGYDMLGAIIERVAGQPYADFIRQNIFTPVGMTGSFLLPADDRLADPDVAQLYGRHGEALEPYPVLPWLVATGAGEIFTSIEELYAYDQALYDETLLSQATLAEAHTPHVLKDGSIAGDALGQQGLGWQILELHGARAIWHAGGGFGVDAALLRFTERQLTVISLLNTEDRFHAHYPALLNIIALYLKAQGIRG